MALPICFKCQIPLTPVNDSEEHILINAIGGRKVLKGFACQACNLETGGLWDAELAKQLNPIGLLLGIKRDRGTLPTQIFKTVSGEKAVAIDGNSQMTIAKPTFTRTESESGTQIQLIARTMREARQMLAGLRKEFPDIDVDGILNATQPVSNYLDEPLHMSFDFGGEKAGRSLVKSALAMVHEAGIPLNSCENALQYLRDPTGKPCFGYYYSSDLVTNRPQDIVFHCVSVQGRPQSKQLLGYIELYSAYRVVICLSESYTGHEFTNTYSINPATGELLNLKVDIPLSNADINAAYQYEKIPPGSQEKAMSKVLEISLKNGYARERDRVLNEAVDFAVKSLNLTEDAIIPPDQVNEFTGLMLEKLTPYLIRHVARRPGLLDDHQEE